MGVDLILTRSIDLEITQGYRSGNSMGVDLVITWGIDLVMTHGEQMWH